MEMTPTDKNILNVVAPYIKRIRELEEKVTTQEVTISNLVNSIDALRKEFYTHCDIKK